MISTIKKIASWHFLHVTLFLQVCLSNFPLSSLRSQPSPEYAFLLSSLFLVVDFAKVCLRQGLYVRCRALGKQSLSNNYDGGAEFFCCLVFSGKKNVFLLRGGDFFHTLDVSSYASEEQINLLRSKVDVSSSEDQDLIILEICLPSERVTLTVSSKPFSPYLYFYLPSSKTWEFFSLFTFF